MDSWAIGCRATEQPHKSFRPDAVHYRNAGISENSQTVWQNPSDRLSSLLPTVLREGRFRVVIFLPPREHGPPHVHVRTADGEVIMELATVGRNQIIRSVAGMRTADVTAAFWLVEDHSSFLLAQWRSLHG